MESVLNTGEYSHFYWRYGHGPNGLKEAQVHKQAVGAGIPFASGGRSMECRGSHSVGAQKGGCWHLTGQRNHL